MGYLLLKFGISAGLIVGVSEIAKRSTLWGAVLASIPLVSVLAMIWLYAETRDAARVAALSTDIFWLVLPSLALFLVLPLLLRAGWPFWPALATAVAATVAAYALMLRVLGRSFT
jgi:cobalamin synthase